MTGFLTVNWELQRSQWEGTGEKLMCTVYKKLDEKDQVLE